MRWAKIAVVLGSLLVVAAFCFGTSAPFTTTVAGDTYRCGEVIGSNWLVSGQPVIKGPDNRTTAERRLHARIGSGCAPLEQAARWLFWSGIVLGGLALLTGWTALREREHDEVVAARRTDAPVAV
jgi:hypothetical protein